MDILSFSRDRGQVRGGTRDSVKEMILQQLELENNYDNSGKMADGVLFVLRSQNSQGPLYCCVALPWINASLTIMDPS